MQQQIAALRQELADVAATLPGVCYMDPPDGGAPTVAEQVRRMAKDASRYQWIRDNHERTTAAADVVYTVSGAGWDAAIDAAMAVETPNG